MRSIFSKQLSYKHFSKVVFSHESRYYSFLPLAFFVSVMRFLVAHCMVGSVDEFYAISPDTTETLLHGRLHCLEQSISGYVVLPEYGSNPSGNVSFGMLRCALRLRGH